MNNNNIHDCDADCKAQLVNAGLPIYDDALLETTVNIMAAMADISRLKLLLLLHNCGELCVSSISTMLDDKTNTVSMRLKKLYDAGLVSKRRDAKHIYYTLRDEHVVTIIENAQEHAEHIQR